MTFYPEPPPQHPVPPAGHAPHAGAPIGGAARPPRSGGPGLGPVPKGVAALVVGIVLLLVMGVTPAPYVLRQPGPVINAIGEVELTEGGEVVPVISITGAPTYEPESGRLDVMTVSIAGNPRGMPGWFEAFTSYLTDERDVVPVEVYYPHGQDPDDRTEENVALMQSSQADAIAAALLHQGYEVGMKFVVYQVNADGASVGLLEPGDVLVSVAGAPVESMDSIRAALEGNAGTPVDVVVLRDGEEVTASVTPVVQTIEGETRPLLGITVSGDYDFPIDVNIQLGDVGGPSAGLIFTLSIIDKLTPGDLTGGHHIAGTGTITPEGEVGPIGGVRQKLHAAVSEGAEAFLVPVDNCGEVLDGGVPGDLPVFAVTTLDEALTAVTTIAEGGDVSALPTCASYLTP